MWPDAKKLSFVLTSIACGADEKAKLLKKLKKKAAKVAKKQKQQAAADAKQAKKEAAAEAAAQKREPVMGFPFNGGATTTSLRRASGYAPVNGYAYLEAGRNSVVDAPV